MRAVPLVSISCLTYNHGQYLRTCLDGFIKQKVSFEYEVLIYDDASNDQTKEIIEEYVEKYPNIFFPIFQEQNQYQKGVRGMMARYNFPRARGKYIALCEGDDFWTDPLKLQKQVDFLENNPHYMICFHKAKVLQNGVFYPDPLEERYDRIKQHPVSKMDLLEQSNFMHTHSVVFRNLQKEFPIELNYSPAGDFLMHLTLAESGYIHRIDEEMGVYRIGSGIYSTLNSFDLTKQKLKLEIAIVSMLQKEEEKEVMIQKIFQRLDRMKNPLSNANIFDSLKDVVSAKLLVKILLHKLKSIFIGNRQ